jgi:hypothetical protein
VGGPVIIDSGTRTTRWLAVGLSLVIAIGGVAAAVAWWPDEGAAGSGALRVGAGNDAPGTPDAPGGPGGPGPGGQAPAEEPVDLLETDPRPALRALHRAVGGDYAALEIILYPDYAVLEYQDPAAPTHAERLVWRPSGVTGPDPVSLPQGWGAEVEAELFDPSEVRFGRLPAMAQEALAAFDLENPTVTHVIVGRFLPWDAEINVRVYVRDVERGGGGYVRFSADGRLIEATG